MTRGFSPPVTSRRAICKAEAAWQGGGVKVPGVFTTEFEPEGDPIGTAVLVPGRGYPPMSPLLFFTGNQAFVNALNSYLNVMSVVVSSTVLLYATIADVLGNDSVDHALRIALESHRRFE